MKKSMIMLMLPLMGCTSSQLESMTYPSMQDTKILFKEAIDSGKAQHDSLSDQHKEMAPEIAAKLTAIQEAANAQIAAAQERVAAMEGSVALLIKEKINPLSEQVLGFPFIIDKIKEDQADAEAAITTVTNKMETVEEKLLTRITELDATQVNRIIESALDSDLFRLAIADAGLSKDDVAQMIGVTKEELEEALKSGDLPSLLLTAFGSTAGGATLARMLSSSGKRIDKLEQKT